VVGVSAPEHEPRAGVAALSEAAPLLEVRDLHVEFRTELGAGRAVDGVSFVIGAGETLALVGESGCGKSVTALALLRLVPEPAGRITAGEIRLRGRSLLPLPEPEMRRVRGREIGIVFQDPVAALNPVFTCGDQVAEMFRVHLGCSAREARDRGLEMLRRVHLGDPERVQKSYPHEISGGMAQRVMLAIALACGPSLLVADEPTTALDVTVQAQIRDLLLELRDATGMALLLISHDLGLVAGMAHRVAIMYAGRIVEAAPVERLLTAPRHPYTAALLASLPTLRHHTARLPAIPGTIPHPARIPPYCRFHARCTHRIERCERDDPALQSVAADHEVACWVDLSSGRRSRT
jgi:oligopeptide/dipeptide ABC transporter ATP-binding protein